MHRSTGDDRATLHAKLSQALALADSLGLAMAAIHIDQARALIAPPAPAPQPGSIPGDASCAGA